MIWLGLKWGSVCFVCLVGGKTRTLLQVPCESHAVKSAGGEASTWSEGVENSQCAIRMMNETTLEEPKAHQQLGWLSCPVANVASGEFEQQVLLAQMGHGGVGIHVLDLHDQEPQRLVVSAGLGHRTPTRPGTGLFPLLSVDGKLAIVVTKCKRNSLASIMASA